MAAIFAAVAVPGFIPTLRHDWNWPVDSDALSALCASYFSGWLSAGLGEPSGRLSGYILAIPLYLVGRAVGTFLLLKLFAFAIGAILVGAVAKAGAVLRLTPVGEIAISLFLLFNPFVYNEIVAGHLEMLLAYACTAFLATELWTTKRPWVVVITVLFIYQQIQFYFIAAVIIVACRFYRASGFGFVCTVIIALPLLAGALLNYQSLSSVPFSLGWEHTQSVDWTSSILLEGYFAGYATIFATGPFRVALVIIAICASLAAVSSHRRGDTTKAFAITAFSILVVAGIHEPFGGFEDFLFSNVKPLEVYRELYDLVGYIALSYGFLLCVSLAALRWLRIPVALCSAALAIAWLVHPVSAYLVPAADVPVPNVMADRNTRFALIPPFQPLSYEDRGSGTDPFAYARDGNITPLNEYIPAYPENSAFALFLRSGDLRPLAALSVATVVLRRGFTSEQSVFTTATDPIPRLLRRFHGASVIHPPPFPEISLSPLPAVGGLCDRPGAGCVFFGDLVGLGGSDVPPGWRGYSPVTPVKSDNAKTDAAASWVDAQLLFARYPQIAQGLGGIATTSSQLVRVKPHSSLLVYAEGRLYDARSLAPLARQARYAWIHIGAARSVRCAGLCVIAAQGMPPRRIALNPSSGTPLPLEFDQLTSWLARADVPAGRSAMLRYNVRFSRGWVAVFESRLLPHFRIDTSTNAWVVPARQKAGTILILHVTSLLQFVLEIAALACCMAFFARCVVNRLLLVLSSEARDPMLATLACTDREKPSTTT